MKYTFLMDDKSRHTVIAYDIRAAKTKAERETGKLACYSVPNLVRDTSPFWNHGVTTAEGGGPNVVS